MDKTTPPKEALREKLEEIHREEEERRTKRLATKLKLPYLDLSIFPLEVDSIITITEEEARKAEAVVLRRRGRELQIGVKDPKNPQTLKLKEELEKKGFACKLIIVSLRSLEIAWERYKEVVKPPREIVKKIEISKEELAHFEKEIKNIKDLQEKVTQLPIIEVLEVILAGALRTEASDIHFEGKADEVRIRYRIDGMLQDIITLAKKSQEFLVSRIKLLSELKLNVHDVAQDGRFSILTKEADIEVRTSVLPGVYGENIVLRILHPKAISLTLKDLGMSPSVYELIGEQIKKPNGMILTTGPTGSGKTTTLYAFVKSVNKPGIKIITIEDPVEYHLEGITQTQVKPEKGYDFARGLRSIVRQDPDVILVGEVRDKETAEIAMHAALTGHMVFSTLHTNDAAGVIPRLIDMGIKPYIVAPAIRAALAQRLIRKVCKNCSQTFTPSSAILERIKKALQGLPKEIKHPPLDKTLKLLKTPLAKDGRVGCEKCNWTGYKGRIGIFEIFVVDDEMEKLILTSPPLFEIRKTAIRKGMIPMEQDGMLKVLEGITTLEELERVVGT